jgi:hypothetical protein
MNRQLHPEVATEVAGRFSPQDRTTARTLLETATLPLMNDLASVDGARVHMAAIKLAMAAWKG